MLTCEQRNKAEMFFKLMEYDQLTERQLDLVERFERQFLNTQDLSQRQFDVLEDIFNQAAEKA